MTSIVYALLYFLGCFGGAVFTAPNTILRRPWNCFSRDRFLFVFVCVCFFVFIISLLKLWRTRV